MKSVCSIFFHNYYGEHTYWIDLLSKNLPLHSTLYYNLVDDSFFNMDVSLTDLNNCKQEVGNSFNGIVWRRSTNKGKDIGGKLILLDAYQKLRVESDYGLFLHDKKSPHKANNQAWVSDLFKIATISFSAKAIQLFSENPDVGIITASGNLMNEYNNNTNSFVSTNSLLLTELQKQFNIFPPSFQYVAGTMFWFRMQPVNNFFKNYSPLKVREMLEYGNVTDEINGSYTHCWERLLCWIVSNQGYKIKCIEC